MKHQEKQTSAAEQLPEDLHQSHNKLFIAAFKRKETIIDYLTNFVPAAWTAKMDLDKLELDPTNYVTRKMKEFFSDVVYRTTWAIAPSKKKPEEPRNVAITLLFEHKKGHPRHAIHLQFLQYMIEIWTDDIMARRRLTIVIPILIHQGKQKFNKKPFYHYFKDLPEELRGFIPNFDFHLTSSEAIDDEKLFSMDEGSMLRSVLLAYKHLHDSQFVEEKFEEFFKFYEKNPDLEKFFRIFFEYFLENSELSSENLHQHLDIFLSSQLKENTMSTYQNIKLEGKLEGQKEGKLQEAKALAKRLWQKGHNVVYIAELMDRPIELIKKWILAFEKEAENKDK